MDKAIKYVFGGILGVVIIIVLVVMFRLNTIVKSGIEEIGTEMTGTAVTVDRIIIIPFSGKGSIDGLGGCTNPFLISAITTINSVKKG